MVNKKLQLFLHHADIPEPQALVYRRQTVTARERASPAGLIINNPVVKILDMVIDKRYAAQVNDRAEGILPDLSAFIPANDTFYF